MCKIQASRHLHQFAFVFFLSCLATSIALTQRIDAQQLDLEGKRAEAAKRLPGYLESRKAYEEGRFPEAIAGYRRLLEDGRNLADMDDDTVGICHSYALTTLSSGDFPTTIYLANLMTKSRPNYDLMYGLRGVAYLRLRQPITAMDELRMAVRLFPEDEHNRVYLANQLTWSNVLDSINGREALRLLEGLEASRQDDPQIAKIMARAAIETRNLPLAIRKQTIVVNAASPEEKEYESATLAYYEEGKKRVEPFPEIDTAKFQNGKSLAKNTRNSVVRVRVTGLLEYTDTASKVLYCGQFERVHLGSVLNKMGTILISNETLRLPDIDKTKDPDADSIKWADGPNLEVFSMNDDSGATTSLGSAKIAGVDEATGIAILQMEGSSPIAILESIEPIQFQPEHRFFDPTARKLLTENFGWKINATEPKPNADNRLSVFNPILLQYSERSIYYDESQGAIQRYQQVRTD